MKIILVKDIKNVGKRGEIINAKDGYAKNYLIPRGLAVVATDAEMTALKRKRVATAELKEEEVEEARELERKLKELAIKISVKMGESGKLFGSVTNKEIAEHIENASNLTIDRKKIILEEPIKTVGSKTVAIKLHPEVTAEIIIEIIEE